MKHSLFEAIQPYLKPGMTVLDVGAFDLRESKKFAAAGCHVIALDKIFTSDAAPGEDVSLQEAKFEDYVPDQPIDVLFMSYVAPFIEREALFKKLNELYSNCNIIAIRAFTKMPEPSIPKKISLYSEEDIALFPKELSQHIVVSGTDMHPDLQGEMRKWFEVDLIALKDVKVLE